MDELFRASLETIKHWILEQVRDNIKTRIILHERPAMTDEPRLTRQQAIEELRREARELEEKPCSLREYAHNAYKARIRRDLADRLEREKTEVSR